MLHRIVPAIVRNGIRPSRLLCTGDVPPPFSLRKSSSLSSLLEKGWKEETAYREWAQDLALLRERQPNMTIENKPGDMLIKMTYQHKDEAIVVEFECADEDDDDDDEVDNEAAADDDDDEEEEDYDEEDSLGQNVFTVQITRGQQMLQFDCRAGEKLKVDGVSLVSNDAEVPYNGPLFEELEEDVQLGFLDYLNERHVNDDLAVYIAEYAELKEGNEYVSFLEKTKDFVKD